MVSHNRRPHSLLSLVLAGVCFRGSMDSDRWSYSDPWWHGFHEGMWPGEGNAWPSDIQNFWGNQWHPAAFCSSHRFCTQRFLQLENIFNLLLCFFHELINLIHDMGCSLPWDTDSYSLGKNVMLLWNPSAHNYVHWSPVWTFYWILSNQAITPHSVR